MANKLEWIVMIEGVVELPFGADPNKLADALADGIAEAVESVGGKLGGTVDVLLKEVNDEEG